MIECSVQYDVRVWIFFLVFWLNLIGGSFMYVTVGMETENILNENTHKNLDHKVMK